MCNHEQGNALLTPHSNATTLCSVADETVVQLSLVWCSVDAVSVQYGSYPCQCNVFWRCFGPGVIGVDYPVQNCQLTCRYGWLVYVKLLIPILTAIASNTH